MNYQTFDEGYYASNHQDADRPALCFYTRLARSFFLPGRVLEFGSGTGYFLKRLSRHFEVDGFEVSSHGQRHTQSLLPGTQLYSTLDEPPSDTYVGITALHVLEHISDEELVRVLASWKRVLISKGRILCVVPEVGGRGHQLKGKHWIGYGDSTHINLKQREAWKAFFAEHGFQVIKSGTDGLWDFPYRKDCPRVVDFLLHAPGTLLQFLAGRLLLREGRGESLILLLVKAP